MTSVILVLAALAVYFVFDTGKCKAVLEWVKQNTTTRLAIVACLALAAVAMLPSWGSKKTVPDAAAFSLRGVFRGPTASADASVVGALLKELADEIEWDGEQSEPSIRTGAQIDAIRKTARVLRCRGESIGDRQPAARDKIAEYLESRIGEDAGPLRDSERENWVAGLREAGEAAADAAQ